MVFRLERWFLEEDFISCITGLAYCADGPGRYHELFAKTKAFSGSRLHTDKSQMRFSVRQL